MRKAIILLSGGLDSAVTLFYVKTRGFDVTCLTFDYGQRHRREIQSAKMLAKLAKTKQVILAMTFPLGASSLTNAKTKLPCRQSSVIKKTGIPNTYVPARNIIFLSYALLYAEVIRANSIFIGINSIDYSGYPDCRPEFLKAFTKMAALGTKSGASGKAVKIEAPLMKSSKTDIVKLGKKLNVPFEHTWSCYEGGKHPCGKCDSCMLRADGFKEAGIVDSLKVKGAR